MTRLARVAWVAGTPARWLLLAGIRGYRATLSGLLGGQCRFYPTCSVYAEEAIRARGAIRGSGLAIWRILRCNPYGAGGIDHAPSGPATTYDDILPTLTTGTSAADAATDRVNA